MGATWLVALLLLTSSGFCSVDVPVITSKYSAMVTQVEIGTPPQPLLMSLAFAARTSFLYIGGLCPAFVDCFNTALSDTYEFIGAQVVPEDDSTFRGFSANDNVRWVSQISAVLDFVIGAAGRVEEQLTNVDVAGRLALGFGSPLTRDRILNIRVDNNVQEAGRASHMIVPRWSVAFVDQIQSPVGQLQISANVDPDSSSWQFHCTVNVDGSDGFSKAITASVVPNISDIVVARSDWQAVVDAIIVDIAGRISPHKRLYLPCKSLSAGVDVAFLQRLSFSFSQGRGVSRYISVLPEQLAIRGIVNRRKVHSGPNGRPYCPTRLVAGDAWQLGLPFLASIDSTELDGRSNMVHFNLRRSWAQRPRLVASPLRPPHPPFEVARIPEVQLPELLVTGSGDKRVLILSFSNEWEGESEFSLHLLSPFGHWSAGGILTFTFRKNHKSSKLPVVCPVKEFTGLYHLIGNKGMWKHMETFERFELQLETAWDLSLASYSVKLVDSRDIFRVVLTRVAVRLPSEAFAMEPAQPWQSTPETESDNFCAICRCDYDVGALVQTLPCDHCFHSECIDPWLGQHGNCCMCRAPVEHQGGRKHTLLGLP